MCGRRRDLKGWLGLRNHAKAKVKRQVLAACDQWLNCLNWPPPASLTSAIKLNHALGRRRAKNSRHHKGARIGANGTREKVS